MFEGIKRLIARVKTGKPPTVPVVKFDRSRLTPSAVSHIRLTLQTIEDLPVEHEAEIFSITLESVARGRDLGLLTASLVQLGVDNQRAAEVARYVHNRATVFIDVERRLSLGLTEGRWTHSGAPCHSHNPPTSDDLRRDAAHRAANGMRYRLAVGALVNGNAIQPGYEPGCRCVSRPITPGFDD